MTKMTAKKHVKIGHKNAQKTHKKEALLRQAFIGNCLVIMDLHRFLMSPSPPVFHAENPAEGQVNRRINLVWHPRILRGKTSDFYLS